MRKPKWKSYEDDVLIKYWVGGGYAAVKHLLPNKNDNSCRKRAQRLGLTKPVKPKGEGSEMNGYIEESVEVINHNVWLLKPWVTNRELYFDRFQVIEERILGV